MNKKDIKKYLENGQTEEISRELGKEALEALAEILAKEKSEDIQKNIIITYGVIAEKSGGLSRKEMKPLIDFIKTGKIVTKYQNELADTIQKIGDIAVTQLIQVIVEKRTNDASRPILLDILQQINEQFILESLLAEKITAPGAAFIYELTLRIASPIFADLSQTVYDKSLDYSMDLPIIKNVITAGLNSASLEEKDRSLNICMKYPLISRELTSVISNLLNINLPERSQINILTTMGSIGSTEAVNTISKKITKETPKNIRLAAIQALGEVKADSHSAVSILVKETLYDSDDDIRYKTINALGQIGAPAAQILVDMLEKEENVQQAEIALKRIGEPAIPYLIAGMSNKKTKKYAIDIAKLILTPKYGFAGTVAKLIEFLAEKDKDIQEEVINTILEMGDPGLEAIIHALNNSIKGVRENSKIILDRFGMMNIQLYIENLINNKKTLIQGVELLALLAIYQQDNDLKEFAFDKFEFLLLNPEYDNHIRRAVLENVLSKASIDDNPDVRFGFGQVGYYLGEPAIPYLIQLLNDKENDIVEVVLDSLGLIKSNGSIILPEILQKIHSKAMNVRLSAIKAIGNLGLNEGIPYLVEALDDSEPELANAASEAIQIIGDAGLPALIQVMNHKDPKKRDLIAKLIASYGEKAYQPFIKQLDISSENFQETAVDVIEYLGNNFADILLMEAQSTLNFNIQSIAIRGFGKLKYEPAIPFIINTIQTKDKKIYQAVRKAHTEYGQLLSQELLADFERSSGNVEKALMEYLKDADPQWMVVPIIREIGKGSSKQEILIDMIKKYGEKPIIDAISSVVKENQIDNAKELVQIMQNQDNLVKIAEKAALSIPK